MSTLKIDPPMRPQEEEALICVVETGPVWCGSFPGDFGRDLIVARGWAIPTLIAEEPGHYVVTPMGVSAYITHFGSALDEGEPSSIVGVAEAKANRLARAATAKMLKKDTK